MVGRRSLDRVHALDPAHRGADRCVHRSHTSRMRDYEGPLGRHTGRRYAVGPGVVDTIAAGAVLVGGVTLLSHLIWGHVPQPLFMLSLGSAAPLLSTVALAKGKAAQQGSNALAAPAPTCRSALLLGAPSLLPQGRGWSCLDVSWPHAISAGVRLHGTL